MEISERTLRRMVREVDDRHQEGMRTIGDEIAAVHAGAASRRRFLWDAGAGLALVIGSAVVPVGAVAGSASAQPADDPTIAKFAESVELAAAAAYNAAVQSGKLRTPAVITAAMTFGSHHTDHARAFGAFAGNAAPSVPNPGLLQTVGDQIREAPDETAVLNVAYATENAAAATYLYAIGALQSPIILAATASIMPVEAEHAAVLGYVLGLDPTSVTDYLPPFQTTDEALQQSKFPVAS